MAEGVLEAGWGWQSQARHESMCSRGRGQGSHWAGYWGSLQGPSGDQMGDQVSQQALEGAFLVGLVGDIR